VDEIDQDYDVHNNVSLPEFDKDINKHSHVPIFVGDEGMQQALVTNDTVLGLPTDDFREVFYSSRYDEHNDDYNVDFLDLLAEDYSQENVSFQQSDVIIQPIYDDFEKHIQ